MDIPITESGPFVFPVEGPKISQDPSGRSAPLFGVLDALLSDNLLSHMMLDTWDFKAQHKRAFTRVINSCVSLGNSRVSGGLGVSSGYASPYDHIHSEALGGGCIF